MKPHKLRILICDDNKDIHQDFNKVLIPKKNHEALSYLDAQLFDETTLKNPNPLPKFIIQNAFSGEEALELVKLSVINQQRFSIAFVDNRMPPGWDGVKTIKEIWKVDPDIQIVICTAYSDYSWEETVNELGVNDNLLILKKPFDQVAVRQMACALTEKWLLAAKNKSYQQELKQEVKKQTKALREALSLQKAIFDSLSEGLIVANDNLTTIHSNPMFRKMFNLPDINAIADDKIDFKMILKTFSGQDFDQIFSNAHQDVEQVIIASRLENDKRYECYSCPYVVNKKIIGRVFRFRDMTEELKLQRQLHWQATHDLLTGLPNRQLLHDRIMMAMMHAKRHQTQFAVMFLDLDRFKYINDSINHEAGDAILQEVASRISAHVRCDDTFARIGGDEFIVLMEYISDDSSIPSLIKQIFSCFEQPFHIKNKQFFISLSIGVSIYPEHGQTVEELISRADLAMYYAKKSGGSDYRSFNAYMYQDQQAKLELEAELREAIEHNDIKIVLQPFIDLENFKTIAYEALARWYHPEKGSIMPGDFIELAEDTGLIITLGYQVLESVMKQYQLWAQEGREPVLFSVNVAAAQLRNPSFADDLSKMLAQYQMPREHLILEVRENVVVSEQEILNTLGQLKLLGILIYLDDFGTLHSSLEFLNIVAFDGIKVDRSFISYIDDDRRSSIVKNMIKMGSDLNINVIVEGVETIEQLDILKNMNCPAVQGFYFGKPKDASYF